MTEEYSVGHGGTELEENGKTSLSFEDMILSGLERASVMELHS